MDRVWCRRGPITLATAENDSGDSGLSPASTLIDRDPDHSRHSRSCSWPVSPNVSISSWSADRLTRRPAGPGDGVLQLVRNNVGRPGRTGVVPQVLGDGLGHGQLVDRARAEPHRVLFPHAAVSARPEQ
jgi:hypothetical protein